MSEIIPFVPSNEVVPANPGDEVVRYTSESVVNVSFDSIPFELIDLETLKAGKIHMADLGSGKGKVYYVPLIHTFEGKTMKLCFDGPSLDFPRGVSTYEIQEDYKDINGETKKRGTGKKSTFMSSDFRPNSSEEHMKFFRFLMKLYFYCCRIMADERVKALIDIGIRQSDVADIEKFRDTASFKMPFTHSRVGEIIDETSPMGIFSKVNFDGVMRTLFTNDNKNDLREYVRDIVENSAFTGVPSYAVQIAVNTSKIASLKMTSSSVIIQDIRQKDRVSGQGATLDALSRNPQAPKDSSKISKMLEDIVKASRARKEKEDEAAAAAAKQNTPLISQTGLNYQPNPNNFAPQQPPSGFNPPMSNPLQQNAINNGNLNVNNGNPQGYGYPGNQPFPQNPQNYPPFPQPDKPYASQGYPSTPQSSMSSQFTVPQISQGPQISQTPVDPHNYPNYGQNAMPYNTSFIN